MLVRNMLMKFEDDDAIARFCASLSVHDEVSEACLLHNPSDASIHLKLMCKLHGQNSNTKSL